jgi:antitoxin component HigA of HigAB toxin-antitoxin module
MELVALCPLLPITNKKEHNAAKEMIIELGKRDVELSPMEIGYGKVLAQLIQAYEKLLVGDFFEGVSGNDALKYLLDEHQMKQTEAAHIGNVSKQNLNDFLNGRRKLSREASSLLAAYFRVSPEVFELVKKQKVA